MSKGSCPKLSSESQTNHDNMVKYIADDLLSKGYSVHADHINWPKGPFFEINGYIPDITATNTDCFVIFEIKTCADCIDEHTREQLTAFDKKGATYIIIPPVCSRDNQNCDPVAEVKHNLTNWGLFLVRVGTCDPFTGEINYNL